MFTITDLCPVCHKPLKITYTNFFWDTIKVCPDGHYAEEIYPLLESLILFEKKKEKE